MQLGLVTFVKLLFFYYFFSPFIFSLPISSPQPLPFAEFHSFAPVSIPSRVFFSVLVFGNVFLPQMTDAVIYFVGRAVNVPELNEMGHIWTAALLALTISSDKTVQHCRLKTTQRGT